MTAGDQTHILDVFDFESSEKAILIIYTDDETSKNAIIILLTLELYNHIAFSTGGLVNVRKKDGKTRVDYAGRSMYK